MIRAAKFGDIPRIVALLVEMQTKGKYASVCDVDEKAAHRLIAQAVQRHGHTNEGGMFVAVAEKAGQVEGFMVGALDRVYHIGSKLCANDVFLHCTDKAFKFDALRLFDAYVMWAADNPRVVEIKASWTDALPDAERIGLVYERKGFRRCGAIYELMSHDEQQELAA